MEKLSAIYSVPVCMMMRYNANLIRDGIRPGIAVRIPPAGLCSNTVRTHTVRTGESVFSLSKKYGVTMHSILEKNRLSDPRGLKEGMTIELPGKCRIYTVKGAETLAEVARITGVGAERIAEANGTADLYRGMQLIIPE